MPAISVMIKPASGLCNMRCSYCFYTDEMKNRSVSSHGIMDKTTMENVVRRIMEFADSRSCIAFQGGEPTLAGLGFYRSFLEMEKKYNVKNIKIDHAIQTNGYSLDKEWCNFFAQNHFLAGLSVDGIKATHDAYRKDAAGEDTYFLTLRSAELLRESGTDFNVLTVVNRKTAPKIRKIYEKYRQLGFLWQQYIVCLDPIGEKQGGHEYSLSPEAYGQFLVDLFELWEIDLKQGKQPYIRQFENYIGILTGRQPESCEQRGVCSFHTVVEADGSVYPCDFYALDEYKIGNLNEEGLDAIMKRNQENGFVEKSYHHTEKCRGCRYFHICRGGCRRHREQHGGGIGENYFCKSYQIFFDACLDRMEQIAAACMRGGNAVWNI